MFTFIGTSLFLDEAINLPQLLLPQNLNAINFGESQNMEKKYVQEIQCAKRGLKDAKT
jgi:hypothetical protein